MAELEEQIKVVVRARQVAQGATKIKADAYADWLEQNKVMIGITALAVLAASEEEIKLRDLTLQAYAETGNKAPAVGVGIREVVKLHYDIAKAFDWALEHRIALQLNKSAFDKLAKTAPETRPAFVMVTTEPIATIATNLKEEN